MKMTTEYAIPMYEDAGILCKRKKFIRVWAHSNNNLLYTDAIGTMTRSYWSNIGCEGDNGTGRRRRPRLLSDRAKILFL